MDGEQIDQGGVLGSSMVPILSIEIFAVFEVVEGLDAKCWG